MLLSPHCLLVFTGQSLFQGFLGGAGFRPSTVLFTLSPASPCRKSSMSKGPTRSKLHDIGCNPNQWGPDLGGSLLIDAMLVGTANAKGPHQSHSPPPPPSPAHALQATLGSSCRPPPAPDIMWGVYATWAMGKAQEGNGS